MFSAAIMTKVMVNSHKQLCLLRHLLQYTALGTGCTPLLQCLGRLSLPPIHGTVY